MAIFRVKKTRDFTFMRTHFRDKQYHVSAAIVYGLMKHIKGTGDYDILNKGAMEMVMECAELYRSLRVNKADGAYYEIHDVVGPDEYHEKVNNNAFTNRMAKFAFDTALELIDKYPSDEYNGFKEMLKDSSVDEVRSRLIESKEYWDDAW